MTDKVRSFHQELEQIRSDVVHLAAMVAEFVPRGTEILLSGNLAAAAELIEQDDVIDDLTMSIEEHCYHVLALQQPVASDLRAIITAIKLSAELERSADLMTNVAKSARRLYHTEVDPKLRGLIELMSEEAARLLELAIDAYAEGDAGLGAALDDMDDRLDTLQKDFLQAIFESQRNNALDLEAGVQLAMVGRFYERIGDHAVNIGERVQYLVTGWLPEHTGAARVQARRKELVAEPVAEASISNIAATQPESSDGRRVAAEMFELALDAIPLGVVVIDEAGTEVLRNRFASAYESGRHGEALVRAAIDDVLDEARHGSPVNRTLDLFGPPRRTIVVTAVPLLRSGRLTGVAAIIEDVTERRRLDAIRRDFVTNIGHELRTPVGALSLLAETALVEDDPEVRRRLVERIVNESLRLGATIEDLLELSKIETEESPVREVISVGAVAREAIERIGPAATQRRIPVRLTIVETDPVVIGDRRQLVSAMYNLLDNAVKYSEPDAAVEVVVEVVEDGRFVDLSVIDQGIGIPSRDLERVFERFFRVDHARSRETGGTGLGLAIVRHVMNNHNGEIRVDSRPGEGSTFALRLPIAAVSHGAGSDAADPESGDA